MTGDEKFSSGIDDARVLGRLKCRCIGKRSEAIADDYYGPVWQDRGGPRVDNRHVRNHDRRGSCFLLCRPGMYRQQAEDHAENPEHWNSHGRKYMR